MDSEIAMDSLSHKPNKISHKKKQTLFSVLTGFAFFAVLFLINKVSNIIICPVKYFLGFSCPGCGLTRSFISILNLDFVSAFHYNILSIPLFISIGIYCIFAFADITFNSNLITKFEQLISKKLLYVFYIVIIILSTIFNNVN